MSLTDFLLARIAEDEASAAWHPDETLTGAIYTIDSEDGEPRLAINPARVRAECEAKRRIVEGHAEAWELGREDFLEGVWRSEDHTIRLLAAVYADHPDYREEWKP